MDWHAPLRTWCPPLGNLGTATEKNKNDKAMWLIMSNIDDINKTDINDINYTY